jgi:hypothetical protein
MVDWFVWVQLVIAVLAGVVAIIVGFVGCHPAGRGTLSRSISDGNHCSCFRQCRHGQRFRVLDLFGVCALYPTGGRHVGVD